MMLDIFCIFLAFCMTFFVKKNAGYMSASFIAAVYMFGCIVVLWIVDLRAVDKDAYYFTAMPMPDFSDVKYYVYMWYLSFLAMVCVVAHALPRAASSIGAVNVLANRLGYVVTAIVSSKVLPCVVISCFIFVFFNALHLLSIESQYLWSNGYYLMLKEPDLMGIESALGRIYHFAFRYIGMMYFVLGFLFISKRIYSLGFLCIFAGAYPFLYLLAGNSRWAPMYLAWGVGIFLLANRKVLSFTVLLLMLISFVKVLIGREQVYHGLSHIFDFIFEASLSDIPDYLLGLIVNIFEGGMNLANTLLHNPVFDVKYIALSFSPFFSFIDGFSLIRDDLKYKWAPNVPMSAVSETVSFGILYVILLWGVFCSLIYKVDRLLMVRGGVFSLLAVAICSYISLGMHTYSVRTFWKLLLVLLIAYIIADRPRSTRLKNVD